MTKELINISAFSLGVIGAFLIFINFYIGRRGGKKVQRWVRVRYVWLRRGTIRKIILYVIKSSYLILLSMFTAKSGFFSLIALFVCFLWSGLRISTYTYFFSNIEEKLVASGVMDKHPFMQEHQALAQVVTKSENWDWVISFGFVYGVLIWLSSGVTGVLLKRIVTAGRLRLLFLYVPIDFSFSCFITVASLLANSIFALIFYIVFSRDNYIAQIKDSQEFLIHFTTADLSGPLLMPTIIYMAMLLVLTVVLSIGRYFLMFLTQLFLVFKESDLGFLKLLGVSCGFVATLLVAYGKLVVE